MEHPIFFLTWICEQIGLGDFAHHYPHLLYTWLAMIVLVLLGIISTKGISMIPNETAIDNYR